MRIHHLNAISTCPLGGRVMDGKSNALRGRLTCHCLLVETRDGLVLVDTGLGVRDCELPRVRLSKFFLALVKPELREEMTAVRQIEALGYDPRDVRHIVLSHLDFDHAGGLDDFPWARVHMLASERDAAMAQKTMLDRMRYRPQQWPTRDQWKVYGTQGEKWFGFDAVRGLEGVPHDILMVPLIGHTLGHAGIAVRRSNDWLLLCADAYFYHREMDVEEPYCSPGLRVYQRMMEKDRKQRLMNQARLRELVKHHSNEVSVICSHDVVEFERVSGRSHRVPAGIVLGDRAQRSSGGVRSRVRALS